MTALRPDLIDAAADDRATVPNGAALRLILSAVSRRRSLAHGELHVGKKHCALGCLWADTPGLILFTSLVDEVAAFNDLTPRATPRARWKRMMKWLRKRVADL